jgi:carbamoyl-phosphate synthase large subunit
MATVLVTGVGSTGGTATVAALQEHTEHEVVGVDMDPMARGLYMVERGETVPPASAEEWLDEMTRIIRAHDVEAVVPLVDEELVRLPELGQEMPEVAIVAPQPAVVEATIDKYRMVQEFPDSTIPDTDLAIELDDLEPDRFPVIVKPRFGRGSRGVQRFDTREGLQEYLLATERALDELIVQRFVEGTEYTTSVVATQENRLLSIVPKEAIEKNGCTVIGVTRDAPHVREACERIFRTVCPCGPMNVQQIVDEESDRVYTIEVNPRFSSTAVLTVQAGVNEVDLLIRDAIGERVEPPQDFETDLCLLRYTDELFIPERDLHQ